MKKIITLCCLFLVLLCSSQSGFAQSTSWKGTVNTYWNNALNWTNGIPDATKDVIMGDANFTGVNHPKVNVVGDCKSITIGGTRATTCTFTRTLNIHGNLTINANGVVEHPNTTTNLTGNFINNGIYKATATSTRIIMNGTNQTVGGVSSTVFRRLTINASCTLSLTKNIKVDSAGSFLAVYGVIDPGQSPTYTITSTGISRIYDMGRLKVNGSAITSNYVFTGTTTLYAGSVVEYSSTVTDQVVSSAYAYSTLIISGTGRKSLAANMTAMYAKDINNGKLFINSGIFDLQTFTANRGTTKVGGTLSIAAGALLKVSGLNNFPVNFATKIMDAASTVEYNGVDQTVSPQIYGNLYFSTAGIKTSAAAFSTMGDLTINNSTLNTNAVVINHGVGGNFTMTGGAFTGTNYTYTLNGTANQNVSLSTVIAKLTINKASGTANLISDVTVSTTLNFTKGNISTGSNNVIIPATASVTGAAQNTGWVQGNLKKSIGTGPGIYRNFEVGDVNYSPVSILFNTVSIAGDVTASSASIDQPEIDYSGIDPAKTVNRYWSLNNNGVLFSIATVIFNWQATDVDGGATTSNFKAGLFNGTNWIMPNTSGPLPTTIQASGITSLGDFSVGEKIGKSTWTGNAMTADWFTPKNWQGLIPSATDPTYILNGLAAGRVYPVLTSGTGIVKDLTVENAASLTVSNGTLQVAGVLTSSARINATAGTLDFNGSSLQTIPPGTFTNDIIKNLTVSNNLSLDDHTVVSGVLSVANSKTLYTNDLLVLKSDANGTARVAPLPVDGTGNATAFINGNVSIERYIPARKAWRLLSTPVKAGTRLSLAEAWQEGSYSASFAPNPNPNPGYGVHIAGGTVANGFDQSTTNAATVKTFNSATNAFVALPASPGTFVPLTTYPGYFVYIRGDRGIDLSQGNNAAVTTTTLRMKGEVNTGKMVSNVNATNFTLLGNPYPSPIDFATITKNNVKNSFYIWDPKLAGTSGLGAYVTVSWNSGTGGYDVTSSASPISQYVPSGEAILVESLDGINPGTVTIKESDKTAGGSDQLFGRAVASGQKLRTNLYALNPDASSSLLDGTLITYADNNSNDLDREDVKKLTGESENISLQRQARFLAIERRRTISDNDTAFYQIADLKQQQYKLEIVAEQLDRPGFTAFLKDNYSSALNNTSVTTNGTTEILFTVNSDPASYAADRFSVVFAKTEPKPFAFTAVSAAQQQRNIAVEWKTKNEVEINTYSIEGSADGIRFNSLSHLTGQKNKYGITTYSWFDLNAVKGDHYYRIRASASAGGKEFSQIVKVNINSLPADPGQLIVYPNPVKNNTVSLQIGDLGKGSYQIEVFNLNGQLLKRVPMQHSGGDMKYSFALDGNLPAGKYQIKLAGSKNSYITSMIKE